MDKSGKPSMKTTTQSSFIKDLCLLGILFSFLFSFYLGNRPLATPDEGRYVEIPREMVVTGDYVTPRLNGVKYFEKPPLLYWLQSASIKVFGLNEAAMRFWVVAFSVLGCLATYCFGRSVFDRATGIVASFILGTTVLYFCLGRLIILDMPISILVTIALFCFYRAVETPPSTKRRLWFYAFSAICALGVLTKGVMALAVPGPVIVLWATLTRQWSRVFPVYLLSSLLIFLSIAAPWHILVSLKNPEFAHKYFVVEHFLRYTTDVHLRYKPIWFFIPILFAGFLPWTAFLPKAIGEAWKNKNNPVNLFLLLWIGWVFSFFSVSNSKLIPYILPLFPPLALLLGKILVDIWQNSYQYKRTIQAHSALSLLISLSGVAVIYLFPELLHEKASLLPYIYTLMGIFFLNALLIFLFTKKSKIYTAPMEAVAAIAPAAIVITASTFLLLLKQLLIKILRLRPQQIAISIIPFTSLAILGVLVFASPHMQRPSIKPLTEIINQNRGPLDKVVSFMTYYQDLPVYTQQTVTVVEAKGELAFGTIVEDTSSWMIKEDKFLELWKSPTKLWVIGRKTELEELHQRHPDFQCKILGIENGNVLFTQDR